MSIRKTGVKWGKGMSLTQDLLFFSLLACYIVVDHTFWFTCTQMVKLLYVLKHASQCRATNAEPCSYPNCSQIKKLFSHASRCEIRVNQGCQLCKKTWFILTAHSRNCEDSECRIPRCRCVSIRILHYLENLDILLSELFFG
jgi:hypothetical protein